MSFLIGSNGLTDISQRRPKINIVEIFGITKGDGAILIFIEKDSLYFYLYF